MAAGVGHLVKINGLLPGAASPDPNAHMPWQTNQELQASGMAWTLRRPNFFMQDLLMFARQIRGRNRFYLNSGNATTGMIDVRDVATAAVARLLTEKHKGPEYILIGPVAISFVEAMEELSAATCNRIVYKSVGSEEFKLRLMKRGMTGLVAGAQVEGHQVHPLGSSDVSSRPVP